MKIFKYYYDSKQMIDESVRAAQLLPLLGLLLQLRRWKEKIWIRHVEKQVQCLLFCFLQRIIHNKGSTFLTGDIMPRHHRVMGWTVEGERFVWVFICGSGMIYTVIKEMKQFLVTNHNYYFLIKLMIDGHTRFAV